MLREERDYEEDGMGDYGRREWDGRLWEKRTGSICDILGRKEVSKGERIKRESFKWGVL